MFKNKIVIVTGSGSGIGRATAKLFSQNNAIVCATDLDIKAKLKKQFLCVPIKLLHLN